MKLKKILAAMTAATVASAIAISASAEVIMVTSDITETYVTYGGSDGNFMVDLDGAGVTPTEVAKVTIEFEAGDLSKGFGGGFILSTKANNWQSVEWGNDSSGKEIIAEVVSEEDALYAMSREVPDGFFDAHVAGVDGEYAQIALQQWWGDAINVTSVTLDMKDGSQVVIPNADADTDADADADVDADADADTDADADADADADVDAEPEAPAEDGDNNENPAGGLGAVALVGLALAGAGAVATKKRK